MTDVVDDYTVLAIFGSLSAFITFLLCICAKKTSSWCEECEYCEKSFIVSDKHLNDDQNEILTVMEYQEHVRECCFKHKERLSRRPAEAGIVCPLCTGPITLCTPQEIHKFYCQAGDPPCPASNYNGHGERMRFRNDGSNHYACVPCNYSLCSECMNRRIRGAERRAMLTTEAQQQQQQQQHNSSVVVQLEHHQPQQPAAAAAAAPTTPIATAPPPSYDDVIKEQHQGSMA